MLIIDQKNLLNHFDQVYNLYNIYQINHHFQYSKENMQLKQVDHLYNNEYYFYPIVDIDVQMLSYTTKRNKEF